MNRPELVCWFNTPPVVEVGAYNYVATNWTNKVTFISVNPLRDERKRLGWNNSSKSPATEIQIDSLEQARQYVDKLNKTSPGAIHIFAGFSKPVSPYLDLITTLVDRGQIVVSSERPGIYGPLMKRILKTFGMTMKQKIIYHKYYKKVSLILPMGKVGVREFQRYGWSADQLMPFMYSPRDSAAVSEAKEADRKLTLSDPLKMLYIGRFSKFTKGTDTLIAAVNKLARDSWSLDLIGGYGDLTAVTVEWAERRPNINFLGTKTPAQIEQLISEYDVCIVPSKFDGWNVVVNEAIQAGVGVICTDQTVSHELIQTSGAGIVVPANDPSALMAAIEKVFLDPSLISVWNSRAIQFANKISNKSVGSYLIDVLDHKILYNQRISPIVPWH